MGMPFLRIHDSVSSFVDFRRISPDLSTTVSMTILYSTSAALVSSEFFLQGTTFYNGAALGEALSAQLVNDGVAGLYSVTSDGKLFFSVSAQPTSYSLACDDFCHSATGFPVGITTLTGVGSLTAEFQLSYSAFDVFTPGATLWGSGPVYNAARTAMIGTLAQSVTDILTVDDLCNTLFTSTLIGESFLQGDGTWVALQNISEQAVGGAAEASSDKPNQRIIVPVLCICIAVAVLYSTQPIVVGLLAVVLLLQFFGKSTNSAPQLQLQLQSQNFANTSRLFEHNAQHTRYDPSVVKTLLQERLA